MQNWICEVIDVDANKDITKVSSSTLGVKNVSPEEFEAALMTNPVYEEVKKIFGIQNMQTFDQFLDRQDAEKKGNKKTTIDDIPVVNIGGDQ